MKKAHVALGFLLFLGALWNCSRQPTAPDASTEEFRACWEYLTLYFLFQDSLPADPYVRQSPKELFDSLREPYTRYLSATEAAGFLSSLTTHGSGMVGIRIDSADGRFFVHWVIPGSPAQQAGLQKGDTLLAVNDSLFAGRTLSEVVGLIRGNEGDPRAFRILRDTVEIEISTCLGSFAAPSLYVDSLDDSLAYVGIVQFADSTSEPGGSAAEFRKALAVTNWAPYTLLDLRANPGGFLQQAIDIASECLDAGTSLVRFRQRVVFQTSPDRLTGVTMDSTYSSAASGMARQRKFVMLADSHTASASELVIAILRDQRQFKLVGQKTYGKARAQVAPFTPQNGLAIITYAKMTPLQGADYDMDGIVPDYATATSREALEEGIRVAYEMMGVPLAKLARQQENVRRLELLHSQWVVPWKDPLCLSGITREGWRKQGARGKGNLP